MTIAEPLAPEMLACVQCGREVIAGELRGGKCLSCWLGIHQPAPTAEDRLGADADAIRRTEAEHAWYWKLLTDQDPPLLDEWLLLTRPAWMAKAACAGLGVERFFPADGGNTRRAREVCAGCTVRNECLDYAVNGADLPAACGVA